MVTRKASTESPLRDEGPSGIELTVDAELEDLQRDTFDYFLYGVASENGSQSTLR